MRSITIIIVLGLLLSGCSYRWGMDYLDGTEWARPNREVLHKDKMECRKEIREWWNKNGGCQYEPFEILEEGQLGFFECVRIKEDLFAYCMENKGYRQEWY